MKSGNEGVCLQSLRTGKWMVNGSSARSYLANKNLHRQKIHPIPMNTAKDTDSIKSAIKPFHPNPEAASHPSIRRYLKAAVFAVLCGGFMWPLSSASAEDRVLARWDFSAEGAVDGFVSGLDGEAGELKVPASAIIEKDAGAPGGQALMFSDERTYAKSANKVSVPAEFTVELTVKISPLNSSDGNLVFVTDDDRNFRISFTGRKDNVTLLLWGGDSPRRYVTVSRRIPTDCWISITASVKDGMMGVSVDGDSSEKPVPADFQFSDANTYLRIGGFIGSVAKFSMTAK